MRELGIDDDDHEAQLMFLEQINSEDFYDNQILKTEDLRQQQGTQNEQAYSDYSVPASGSRDRDSQSTKKLQR